MEDLCASLSTAYLSPWLNTFQDFTPSRRMKAHQVMIGIAALCRSKWGPLWPSVAIPLIHSKGKCPRFQPRAIQCLNRNCKPSSAEEETRRSKRRSRHVLSWMLAWFLALQVLIVYVTSNTRRTVSSTAFDVAGQSPTHKVLSKDMKVYELIICTRCYSTCVS